MNRFVTVGSLLLLCSLPRPGFAQQADSVSVVQQALREGNQKLAVEAATQLLSSSPDDLQTIMLAADVFLRCNHPDRALPLYDRYIEAVPQSMPRLWQRGIAQYFVGQYAEGAEQFVKHREVNPHDVENAAWHYLCLAKARSIDVANKSVLPAPHDSRIPMAEVQQLLLEGDPELVEKAMRQVPQDSPQHASALFYGNFYLGLYADANGDHQTALDRMTKAANNAPRHYMGDIARVYAEHLLKAKQK